MRNETPELEALINNAYNHPWSVDTRIDWTRPVELPDGMDPLDYIDMVSQLHHTEILTIELCARLIREVPELQAKRFLCTQIADESRHAQAYAMYVGQIGPLAPIDEALRRTFEAGLAWDGGSAALILALNVVLEGESLHQQRQRIDTLPCPLFRQINTEIMRDEARHAKFGTLYLREKIPTLSVDERAAMRSWVSELWNSWEASNADRYASAGAAVLRTTPQELAARRQRHFRMFESIGLIP